MIAAGAARKGSVLRLAARFSKVRIWHLADIGPGDEPCLLLGIKRTSLISSSMSANDPKQTYRLTDWDATAVLHTTIVQLPCRLLPISGFIVSPSAYSSFGRIPSRLMELP